MGDIAETETEPAPAPLILLVEDDILIRLSSGEVLREAGYRVVEADNGEEALSLLQAGLGPALIVSDIRMPGAVDGLKLLDLVRELYPPLRVLLASSHLPLSREGHRDVRFLPKPYTAQSLVDEVRSMTGGS